MKIKKGDNVIILTGKDKGKSGKVIRSLPKLNKVVVEGVNLVKRNQRSKKSNQKGQILEVAMPINISNIRSQKTKVKKQKK